MTPSREQMWLARDPWADIVMMVTATFDQIAFRFRADDGNETGASWLAAENTGLTNVDLDATDHIRLRIGIQETAGGSVNNLDFTLQYRINGGAGTWTNVDSSTVAVVYQTSSFVANETATTDQLTTPTGTFREGAFVSESGSTARINFSGNDHGENEYSLRLIADDLDDGDQIEFRLLGNGSVLNAYSQTPSLTVTFAPRFTGDVAFTEADDTVVAAGTHVPPEFSGSVAFTETDDSVDAAGATLAPPSSMLGLDGSWGSFAWGSATWGGIVEEAGDTSTGTIAYTEADDTVAAAATFRTLHTGTVAYTEADDELAASGTHVPPEFAGTVAFTEGDDSLAAAGTHVAPEFAGSIAYTEADDTVEASGTHVPLFTGSVAYTEGDDTLAASGTFTLPEGAGSIAFTEDDDTIVASGTHVPAYDGTIAYTEADDEIVAAGTHVAPTFAGTAAYTEADDEVAASGTHVAPTFSGMVAYTETDDTAVAAGTHTPPAFAGSIAFTETDDDVAAAGTTVAPTFTGAISYSEADDSLAASGTFTGEPTEPIDIAIAYGPTATWHPAGDANVPPVAVAGAAFRWRPCGTVSLVQAARHGTAQVVPAASLGAASIVAHDTADASVRELVGAASV